MKTAFRRASCSTSSTRTRGGERAGEVQAADDTSRRYVELYAAYDEQCNREGVVDFPNSC